MTAEKLWAGRFGGPTDSFVEAFTASIEFDQRLYDQDIRGSMAHARMLDDTQLIPAPQIQFPEASLIFDTQVELGALLGDARDVNGDEIIGRD